MNRNNWYLWVTHFLLLGVIARYAALAGEPPSPCKGFFGTDATCEVIQKYSDKP